MLRLASALVLFPLTFLAACSSDSPEGSSGGASSTSSSSGGSSSSSGGSSSGGSSSGGSSSGGSSSGAPTYSTEVRTGIATYYDADGSGNCSYEKSPQDMDVVALNRPDYAGSAMCGACLKVTGPKGTVTVRVVDSCPECESGHLDLSREAFAKIADMVDGRVSISFQTVSCASAGPLGYRFKEGSSQYWTAIQVRRHTVPVQKLEVQKDGQWVDVQRESYNYFVDSSGIGLPPPGGFRVRVTGADGRVVEDTIPRLGDGEVVAGSATL